VLRYKAFGYSLLALLYSKCVSTISTINNVFSVQLHLACRDFVSKLLNCFLQLVFFGDQRLLLLLFQDHITSRFMLRSKNELNIPLRSIWLKTSVSFHES